MIKKIILCLIVLGLLAACSKKEPLIIKEHQPRIYEKTKKELPN